MERVALIDGLRRRVAAWRSDGERIGFVPTMGNLHAGHFALVEQMRHSCDRVVASVFVNPMQFGPKEDFASYPRTIEADAHGLSPGCDLLFAPSVVEMYPQGAREHVEIHVPGLSDILCGASRPGHFTGVATVVAKLLNMVQPDVAVFGQKDYQQLLVIRRMVADLAIPVVIESGPTVREADGLALSSRNQYLAPEERDCASTIYRTLNGMAERMRSGDPGRAVEDKARDQLASAGFEVDYAVVRRASDLAEAVDGDHAPRVALIAARLGRARLIDNLLI